MRITAIRETAVPLHGDVANSLVNFSGHTISLVAVVSDVIRDGRPVAGVAFDSIGRFAQSGILRDRMIPRVLAAEPDSLLGEQDRLDPAAVLARAMRDEKPGGHGDRAAAAGALELACWDLNAKLDDEPAYVRIARHFARAPVTGGVPVYAAGGYYYPDGGIPQLRAEIDGYREMGYGAYKMKIGGAPLADDLARIEAVIDIAGGADRVAVDANGRFDRSAAVDWGRALSPYGLRWYEEAGDPLDFDLNHRLTDSYAGAVATGENLFSVPDVTNLVRFGGMRRNLDIFQMDAGLSYGLTEYARMLEVLEEHGFDREFAFPHGGHLLNLHIVAGLGLGGCESYPGVFQPFGGYSEQCALTDGRIAPTDAPGFGLEQKSGLSDLITDLLA